ncbi:MAG: Fe-S cluster assembly scaffold IscU [Candidatus Marinimicrobia bacterium]|nr:Fe-S cluster assembly scaffold IscU [Candidatus Neomarinimicrobiota bacterium]MBL7022819.1 Fe-S cluster assembly scaffold IscU [Candidatus Neomarinimicrobiota bacterium]MBL7109460.1 Fe-S cluster assembly scaffold IscU [Candidatus Neomarinimicrobiota bacterium]
MAYSKKVVEHFTDPKNMGSMDKEDDNVGTGIVGAPECGDVMKLQLKIEEGIIQDAKFKTFGCGSAIASSSYITELVKGMSVEDAQKVKNTEIVDELSLPPIKVHCSVLAEDGIKAALADYEKKKK